MSLFQKILGLPFVYNHIRPWFVGGISLSPLYQLLDSKADDIIIDVGCGTGVALDYLPDVKRYEGFDTDPVAINAAQLKAKDPEKFHFSCRLLEESDLTTINPTAIILSGLLHHLSDSEAQQLLKLCTTAPQLRRIVTLDVVMLPGKLINNFFAFFDRGKYVRRQEGYRQLVKNSGLSQEWNIAEEQLVKSHPTQGRVYYCLMKLERRN